MLEVKSNVRGIFYELPSFSFLPKNGEKTFWWAQGENTWVSQFIFFPPHPTKHTLKKFSFLFSFQSFPSTLFYLQINTPYRDTL